MTPTDDKSSKEARPSARDSRIDGNKSKASDSVLGGAGRDSSEKTKNSPASTRSAGSGPSSTRTMSAGKMANLKAKASDDKAVASK